MIIAWFICKKIHFILKNNPLCKLFLVWKSFTDNKVSKIAFEFRRRLFWEQELAKKYSYKMVGLHPEETIFLCLWYLRQ